MKIQIKVENVLININVEKNTNYAVLKEQLRDNLCPILKNPNQPWGRIIETIRDRVSPILNA